MWILPSSPRHPELNGLSRSVSFADALARVEALAVSVAVTRVGLTTALDSLGVPTATAFRREVIAPAISVSSGKGLTAAEARLTALAEACERYCAEPRGRVFTRRASYSELGDAALSPGSLVPADWWRGGEGGSLEWCAGRRIRDGLSCFVPANAVFFPYDAPQGELLFSSHTTGLALGCSLAESLAAGLLECVERDQYSLAVARIQRGDSDSLPALSPVSLGATVASLAATIESRDCSVFLRDVTTDLGIPTIVATLSRGDQAHLGCSAHPSAAVAARSALIEAAQSRATWIQGAREDFDEVSLNAPHPWYVDRSLREAPPPASHLFADVADEVRWVLEMLHDRAGIEPVFIDLTLDGSDVFVVRVVTPGLEVWSTDARRAGPRVRALLGSS
jgi:ribosomal protein S12 methylthiotransferase accessory factor